MKEPELKELKVMVALREGFKFCLADFCIKSKSFATKVNWTYGTKCTVNKMYLLDMDHVMSWCQKLVGSLPSNAKIAIARNCKFANLIQYNMQYMPCNSALLAEKTLFLTQIGTFFPQKISKKCVYRNKS